MGSTLRCTILLLTPALAGLRLRLPIWLLVLVSLLPWALIDWLSSLGLPGGRERLGLGWLALEALLALALLLGRPGRWRPRLLEADWRQAALACLAPALLVGVTLAWRGVIVEYPGDSFSYFHKNLSDLQLLPGRSSPWAYDSARNWSYGLASLLLELPQRLSLERASLLAGLNSGLLVLVSTQLVRQLGGPGPLCWLAALLLLLGLGNQEFSFLHQFALNGSLLAMALVLAAATPLLQLLRRERWPGLNAVAAPLLALPLLGFFAWRAHPIAAFFVLNLLITSVAAAWLRWRPRALGPLALAVAAAGLLLLQSRPPHPELAGVLSWPEPWRIVHEQRLFGLQLLQFRPQMPNSDWELSLLAACGLGLTALLLAWRRRLQLDGARLVLALLPLLVLAEWLLPLVNNLVFRLIAPDVAYRLAWTSLFWIGTPLLLQSLAESGQPCLRRATTPFLTGLLALLAVPIHLGERSNVLHAKLPHLITPLAEKREVDGSRIEPLLPRLRQLCERHPELRGQGLLADPMVATTLFRQQCTWPVASLDYGLLDISLAEHGHYPGLAAALDDPAALRAWLAGRRVGLVVLRERYPAYASTIGLLSGHWSATLVSDYARLALNRLDRRRLEQAGFTLAAEEHGFRVYRRL
ncbi:MAG: hypothetical protein VKK62_10400 [Synechococcaceae cyanobacterium]|nr:hypothetical protein [Synechococcaceae cyanobacterium]